MGRLNVLFVSFLGFCTTSCHTVVKTYVERDGADPQINRNVIAVGATNFNSFTFIESNSTPVLNLAVTLPPWPQFTNSPPVANDRVSTTDFSAFVADEILFNLVLFKDFEEGKQGSWLPTFYELASAQCQSLPSFRGQAANIVWSIKPVVEPNKLQRIVALYEAEFHMANSSQVSRIFCQSPLVDGSGKPLLDYLAKTNARGEVELDPKGEPIFVERVRQPQPHSPSEIPGAMQNLPPPASGLGTNQTIGRLNGWYSFDEPTNAFISHRMGPYSGRYLWITNQENFLKFELLVLGATNSDW